MKLNLGRVIKVKKFSYTNKYGGTGLSNWTSKIPGIQEDELFTRPIKVTIVKMWNDYECGIRMWAMPDNSDKELIEFLERNAKKGTPIISDNELKKFTDENHFILFVSEFDVIDKR